MDWNFNIPDWTPLAVETVNNDTEADEIELMLRCDEQVDDENDDEDEDEDNGSVDHVSSNSASSRQNLEDGESEETLSCSQLPALVGYDETDDKLDDEVTNVPNSKVMGDNYNEEAEDNPKDDSDLHKKEQHTLYALRRNPKRSQRFIDEEFALELSPCSGSSLPVMAPKGSISRGNSISSDKARACTECGKEFSSWKALFGHMRCHPEREWRGIQKPVSVHLAKSGGKRNSRKSKSSRTHSRSLSFHELEDRAASFFRVTVAATDDESEAESIEAAYMNGGGFFSNNPAAAAKVVTGKRSKRSRTTAFHVQHDIGDMREERDMANCLVMLACAGKNETEDNEDGTSRSSSGTIDMNVGISAEEVEGFQNPESLSSPGNNTLLEAAGTHPMLLDDVSGVFASGELLEHMMRYECSTCKKIFKSHQALGGHRASHKKVKGCFARTNEPGTGQQQQQQQPPPQQQQRQLLEEELVVLTDEDLLLRSDEQLEVSDNLQHHQPAVISVNVSSSPVNVSSSSSSTALAPATCPLVPGIHQRSLQPDLAPFRDEFSFSTSRKLMRAHECSICHRVFTSGQALGGHKRCHWGGTVERVVVETLPANKPSSAGGGEINIGNRSLPIQQSNSKISVVRPENSSSKLVLRPVLGGTEHGSGKLVIRPVLGGSSKLMSSDNQDNRMTEHRKLTVVFGGDRKQQNYGSSSGGNMKDHQLDSLKQGEQFINEPHRSGVLRPDYDINKQFNKPAAAAASGTMKDFSVSGNKYNAMNTINAPVSSLSRVFPDHSPGTDKKLSV